MEGAVDQTVVRGQERIYKVADNNPAQEVRQEHHRLTGLGQLLGIDFVEEDGQGHRDQNTQNDEHDVVENRGLEHDREIGGFEEEFEIVKPHPFTVVEQCPQEALAGTRLVILEGNDHTEHRRIAKNEVPDRGRQVEKENLQIIKRRAIRSALLFCRLLRFGQTHDVSSFHFPRDMLF